MDFAMVSATQRDCELIADLPGERPALREAEVMSVRWSATADQTGMSPNELDVLAVTKPPRLGQRKDAFVDGLRARALPFLLWAVGTLAGLGFPSL
jgi:hypothetical protein